jgi:hypothetical protein
MDAEVFYETRSEQIAKAMTSYENARQSYQQSLSAALAEDDPDKRQTLLQNVAQQNQSLSTIIQGILSALQSGEQDAGVPTGATSEDLSRQLEAYQRQLDTIQKYGDHIQKLRELLSEATTSANTAQAYYFGYLIAILVLLVAILIMFLFSSSSGSSDMGSALPAGPAPMGGIQVPGTLSFTTP